MFENLPTAWNVVLFLVAALAIWFSAVRLTRHADAIATRTGLGQEMVGLLLLGGVTSLPELAVATTATLQEAPELTIGNLLGAAAINVVLLALADAAIRHRALTSVQGSPKVILIGVLGVVTMAVVVAPTLTGDTLVLGIGGWTWVLLGVYGGAVWVMAHSHAERVWRPMGDALPGRGGEPPPAADAGDSMRRVVAGAAAAAAVILAAGYVLARTGDAIAQQTGLGNSFFGVVVLAMATTLPEASTVVAAVRLQRYEMAISDVLGTNLFNVTIIALVDALHPGGPVLVEAGRFASFAALLALVLTCLFLIGLVERRDRTIRRLGIDSVIALFVYGAGLAVLYQLR